MDSNPSGQDGTTPATGTPPVPDAIFIGSQTLAKNEDGQHVIEHRNDAGELTRTKIIGSDVDLSMHLLGLGLGAGGSGPSYQYGVHGVGWAASPPDGPLPPWPGNPTAAERFGLKMPPEFAALMKRATAPGTTPLHGTPKTPEFAESVARRIDPAYVAAQGKTREMIERIVTEDADRRAKQHEAAARAHIAERLSTKIALHLEGHRGVDMGMVQLVAEAATDAALAVFVDLLRDPPSFVTYPDGTERIEQR